MPVSLRLPRPIETQITSLSLRSGLSKSALIVRSIEEYLSRHAQPSAFDIYQEVMQESANALSATRTHEQRPHKLALRDAVQAKQVARSTQGNRPASRKKST